jgi:hypothetical protein
MARYVPPSARRDLKPPAWLHLDLGERFPRITVRGARAARAGGPLFGPFRDTKAAGRARDALHRRLPLRPCEYTFEPHPELALGLGCVYAQTRTCAAPCLVRASDAEYAALAAEAERLLRGPRDEDEALPAWVTARTGARGLIADPVKRDVDLFPVREGRVLEAHAVRVAAADLETGVRALSWDEAAPGESDWPWLMPWLHAPRRTGRYLLPGEDEAPEALAARLRAALGGGRR